MTFVSNISVTVSGFLHHVFAEPYATAGPRGQDRQSTSGFYQNFSAHLLSTGLLCIGYCSVIDQIVNLFEKGKICDSFGCSLNIAHKLFAVISTRCFRQQPESSALPHQDAGSA